MMEGMSAAVSPAPKDPSKVMQRVRGLAKAVRNKRVQSSHTGPEQTVRGALKSLQNQYADLAYDLPWETLDYVEMLAAYNPDYSQAVENIKMLANPGHTLIVDAPSELQRKRTKELLEAQSKKVQESHGGIDGVVSKLMDMAATYGAMCGEWILSDDLTAVIDFADINPKVIRFVWEEIEQRWTPYQKVSGAQAKEAEAQGQKVINGNLVKLNEQTFMYHAFDAAPQSPYGTPPFLAALNNIAIQRDLVFNMAQIVKKIGLLGMIDVKLTMLDPIAGETDEAYEARCAAYLDEYVTAAEDMAKDGGLAHFDDAEVTTSQLGGNAAGATNIHKANEEMIFSGLKSMPSVQGRSYSTTETYAGVAYDIIIRNTFQYQRGAKRFIERGYWLMASLAGLNPGTISLQFKENRSLNRLQEAQAEAAEIQNAILLWLIGIIDQEGVAHRVGYSEPKTPMAKPPPGVGAKTPPPAPKEGEDEDEEEDNKDSSSTGKATYLGGSTASPANMGDEDEQDPDDEPEDD